MHIGNLGPTCFELTTEAGKIAAMTSINESRTLDAPIDRVWEVVSDVDRDPDYWEGLASVRNIRKEKNLVDREVVVGFMGRKGTQRILLSPKRSVRLELVGGPLRGSRSINLTPLGGNRTRIDVSWNIEFSEIPAFAQGFVRSRLEESTHEALDRIAKAVGSTLDGKEEHSRAAPRRIRPKFPAEWHVPNDPEKWITWQHAKNKLANEKVYWISSATSGGRPHAAPVWGIWKESRFYFETDPKSVKGRNMSSNQNIVVHIQDGSDTVIVEGKARRQDTARVLDQLKKDYTKKYRYTPRWSDEQREIVFRVEPVVVHAWKAPRMHRSLVKFVF